MSYPRELTKDEKEGLETQTSDNPDWTGVYLLSEFSGNTFNCMGWAEDNNDCISIPSKADSVLHLLNKSAGDKKYELITDGDYSDAKFMLFGEGEEVRHITIKLTFSEIQVRSKEFSFIDEVDFKKLAKNGVPDPFWCCAIGFGYGVITHPQNWFENGNDYPDIVGGIKLK